MKSLFTFLAVLTLCTGCRGGRPAPANAERAESIALPELDQTGTDGTETLDRDEIPHIDSLLCGEECAEYTCYFVAGSRNLQALEHVRSIVFDGSLVDIDYESCADTQSANRLRTHLLDSLRALDWLEGEPWTAVRELYLAWSEQQLERNYIVYRAGLDPAYLLDCPRTDSVLVRCADLLSLDGDRFVDEVRDFLSASERAKFERDSVTFDRDYLKYSLSRIEGLFDETAARERLFQLLSNHLNHEIHRRLGKDGTVDFYTYIPDFLQLFDSVKVETWEP